MSGGEQQMLAMGPRADEPPKVLLLDEPSMGLSPIMVDKIFEVVRDVYAQGVTIVLVEQNASRALEIADRGYVMDSGLITMTGGQADAEMIRRCVRPTWASDLLASTQCPQGPGLRCTGPDCYTIHSC
jgi:ABC-type branched-subunit amino acid transport system ATPase component